MSSVVAVLLSVLSWVEAHPVFASMVFWPLITAIVTWLFKPRSEAEYVALSATHPRTAQILRLVGALGLDLPKVLQILGDLARRVPKGPSVIPLLVVSAAMVLGAAACKPGQAPRETARATVLVVAEAVHQLDGACAKIVLAKHDATLGTRCADAYDAARSALIGAEAAIDAYESAGAGNAPCAIARAVDAMQRMDEAIRSIGGSSPPIVDDAFKLAPLLTVACHG